MSRMVNVCARRAMVVAFSVMLGSVAANAQTVVDATTAEFEPSVDHNATESGTPLLTSYVLKFFPASSSTPSHTIDMGKPAPGADGLIRFSFTSRLTTPLVPGITYQASVSAVGPGGTAPSAISNPFTTSSVCSPSISATSAAIAATAATGSVSVVAGTGCTWTATSNASWLTVTSGGSGTGAGSVGYSATANAASAARTGAISVAGHTFTVTQSGTSPCTYTINPASRTSIAAGEQTSVSVASTSTCAWAAVSGAGWITVTAGASGTGNGTVSMTIAANPTAAPRTGTVTIAGRTFTVTQSGTSACTYTINPASRTSIAAGEQTSVSVASTSTCAWAAVSGAGWITVTAGASGTGNGTVSMTIAANPTAAPRTGTVTIAGHTFTVTQSGTSPCTYTINQASRTSIAAGEQTSVSVASTSTCAWAAVSGAGWITVTAGASGTGNGTVSMTIAANPTAAPRTGTVTIAGHTFTVTQSGTSPCTYTINQASRTSIAAGEQTSVSVASTSTCAWAAVSGAGWITVTAGASGTGNGTVSMTIAANPAAAQRTGYLMIAGHTFTVTQSGTSACTYTINQASRTSIAAGEQTSVSVASTSTCAWGAVSGAGWITVTAGASGTGNGTVSMTIAANPAGAQRTGYLMIAGRTFTVTQQGQTCTYTVTPGSLSVPAASVTNTLSITTLAGCAWTASSLSSWVTIATTGQSGPTQLSYTVAANTGPARSGTLTVAGRPVVVNQTGASPPPPGNLRVVQTSSQRD